MIRTILALALLFPFSSEAQPLAGGPHPRQVEITSSGIASDGRSAQVTLRCRGACPELVVVELWPAVRQCRGDNPCPLPEGGELAPRLCENGYTNRVSAWRPVTMTTATLEVPSMWPSCYHLTPHGSPVAILNVRWGHEGFNGTETWIEEHLGWATCGFAPSPLSVWRFGLCP